MNRLACLVLAMLLLVPSVYAEEINLDGLSFEQLVDLRELALLAMWKTDEWQEVEVPSGLYRIGVDIPAEHWNIRATDGTDPSVYYGDTLDPSGMNIEYSNGIYYIGILAGKNGMREEVFPDQYPNSVNIHLKEDAYLLVEGGSVVFSPYAGIPDLGFK